MLQPSDPVMLHTKVQPPASTRNEVERDTVLETLPTLADRCRLLSVCAPAGFGKTTLLAQWARREQAHLAWVSLDPTDNDPARFWRYAIQALRAVLPTIAAGRVMPLLQAFPNVSVPTVIDALLNELATFAEPIVLVLDDYHVIAEQAVHDSLSYMIDYLPDNVRVAIASRTGLPFPASKWSARGERADVGALQLLFNAEEAARFYRHTAGLPLTREQIGKLLASTEGWIAGLQLVAIVLRQHRSVDAFIERFSGYHPKLSEYLLQEAFRELAPELREFVLHTSILQRMDAALCDAFTGRSDSAELLEKARSLNLFLVPLDDFGEWYRYHHLFAEFLQNELKRGDKARWKRLHGKAARLFAERGLLDEAIDHAIAAEEYALAERLLGAHIGTALERGEFSTLLRRFGALPGDPARLSPQLALLYAFLLVVTGGFDRAESLLASLEEAAAAAPADEREQLASGLFFVRANLAFAGGRFAEWYGYADRIPDMLPESAVFYNFNYNRSEPLVRRTEFGLKGALSAEVEAIALRFIGMLDARGWGDALITQYVLQSLAEGYYEWNRLEESEALLARTERVGRDRRVAGLFVPSRLTYARLRLAEGRALLAREAIEEAIETVKAWDEFGWTDPLQTFLARLDLIEGDPERAEERMALLRLSPGDKPAFDKAFGYLTLARLLERQGREDEAYRLLELLKPPSIRERCLSSMAEIAVLQALTDQRRGNRTGALRGLDDALKIARPCGYVRLFLDEGERMAELLLQYVRHRQDAAASDTETAALGYARSLIERFPGRKPAPTASASLVEPLTPSETALLDRLRQGASNKQIAKELNLTEGTVKVYLSRIYGKLGVSSRTQALLKAQELRLFV
ncbi:LuxR C-terminal-related transcriptional regulator [Paenibacillus flagellatus]|uniref:Transcriptional regulator n=1 Tax=Paenibacillus flagellatus TaxID=2211139 RepID=A0A2V5JXM7_9BACL|nr:LuxR C-terminal-related transcriptional regulator [Paenibacillus flagellatus]PYI51548.1 transcriptional regulator [Paenibacillus flagellatus]